jgi:hypothetical protein
VRKWLDRYFTAKECAALDDPLPVWRYLKKGQEPPEWRRRASRSVSHISATRIVISGTDKGKNDQTVNSALLSKTSSGLRLHEETQEEDNLFKP